MLILPQNLLIERSKYDILISHKNTLMQAVTFALIRLACFIKDVKVMTSCPGGLNESTSDSAWSVVLIILVLDNQCPVSYERCSYFKKKKFSTW
jgi:hypothetical protein